MPSREKRKYHRLPKSYRVEAKEFCFPMTSQPFVEFACADISAGGLCVESKASFKQGDKLQVRICVPRLNKFMPGFFKFYENDAEQFINAIVEVAWVETKSTCHLLGLRFLDLDQDMATAIKGLINSAIRDEHRRKEIKTSSGLNDQ